MEIVLRKMKKDQKGIILKISGGGELARRIRDMGINPGVELKVIGRAPLMDPVAIKIRDTVLSLRNNEAEHIYCEVTDE